MAYTPHPAPPPLPNATVNKVASQQLTDYLKNNRLPLVGAQVLQSPDGQRQVILFGYTATGYGKQDAENKVHSYLKDSTIGINNRITIQPELANAGNGSGSMTGAPPASSSGSYYDPSLGNAQQYQQQAAQDPYGYSQYQSQSSAPSGLGALLPFLSMFSGTFGGGSGMFGGTYGGYGTGYGGYGGYGYPAYPPNPYMGYGSPSPFFP